MVLDNITAGKWGDQSSKLNNNFNKTNAEIMALQGIANGGGKLFSSADALSIAYPNLKSTDAGIYAYVSANLSFPAKIYRWSGTTWVDTGQTGNGGDAAENIDATLSTKIVQTEGTDSTKIISQNGVTNLLKNKVDISSGKNLLMDYEVGRGIYSDGSLADYNSEWASRYALTDKIYWKEDDTITCNGCAGAGFAQCQYDASNNPISSSVILLGTRGTHTFTKSVGASYIRLTLDIDVFSDIQVEFGTESTDYEMFNEIGGYLPINKEITVNSDPNSDADFTGSMAIRDAINSITDNSYRKRYLLKVTGFFEAKLPTDYEENRMLFYAMFMCKPYVSIDGGDRNNCIIRGSLPDTLAECQANKSDFVKSDYGIYQPFYIDMLTKGSSVEIKNITFSARNVRYPLHIDGYKKNTENCDVLIENCSLIHDGKYGDSIDTIGGSPSGFGSTSGATMKFKNCFFGGNGDGMFYVHSNVDFTNSSNVIWENCVLQPSIAKITNGIHVESLGNGVDMNVTVKGCKMQKYPWVSVGADISYDMADSNRIRLITDLPPLPIYYGSGSTVSIGLKITSNTTTNSTVRFATAGAFNDIVGYSNKKDYIYPNKYNRDEQYGYQWKDGGIGLHAAAIGLKNLAETSDYKLGVRLGDCSGTNKTLGIIIDGTTRNVTFNKNYTSMTNSAIIAEINTAISGYGVASLYDVNGDWYPEFDGVNYTIVDDTTAILSGMGIVFTSLGVRRAKNSDGYIDGIALDDGAIGKIVRVMTKGSICIQDTRYSLLKVSGFPLWYNMSMGQGIGISNSQDGYFDTNSLPHVLKRASENSAELI